MNVIRERHKFAAFALPSAEDVPPPRPPGVWTLGLLFLGGALSAAFAYTALAYVINPARDFQGNSAFPAVRSDYRSEKIALFDAFAAQGPVAGLVLGSSRSMLLNGERLRQISGGKRFFNFGLASAKAEDFLAALRFTLRRGQKPSHVIIGVDVESLRDARAHGDSIHPLRELAVGEDPAVKKAGTVARRIFTWSYAQDAAQSVYLRAAPRMAAVGFLADGTLQYLRRELQRSEGTFRLEPEMAGCMAASRRKIEDTSELSSVQIGHLKQAVAEARASGATVTLWLTGPHPRTAEHMSSGTAYSHLLAQTWGILRELDSRAFNLHDPQSYGGSSSGYYDCNHFDNSHAQLIERLLITGPNPAWSGGPPPDANGDWPSGQESQPRSSYDIAISGRRH
jgi:hypothetical protein